MCDVHNVGAVVADVPYAACMYVTMTEVVFPAFTAIHLRTATVHAVLMLSRACPCRTWISYSRTTSRASSGELSRQSWGSMRASSLAHPIAIAAAGSAAGSMPSPTATGSLGRVNGELMAKLGGSAGAGQRSRRERPLSASSSQGGPAGKLAATST